MTTSYAPREQHFEDLVVVEGITRSGKFLLSAVLSAFERVEPVQYAPALENLLMLHRLGKLDLESARVLLHMEFDLRAHEMAIGRYLNTRVSDVSCVFRVPGHEKILARANVEDRDELIRAFLEEKRLPLHIYHEGLPNASAFFDVFPKARMVSILRDPAALMVSWHARGWGKMPSAADKRVMWPFFDAGAGPRPWWALDWKEDYAALSEMDRCVLTIAALLGHARRGLEALGPERRGRLCFVRYEDLVRAPGPELAKLGAFLQRAPAPGIEAVLERERLPRAVPDGQRERSLEKVNASMSPSLKPALERACAEYDSFWSPLAKAAA